MAEITIAKTSGNIDLKGVFNSANYNTDNIHTQRLLSAYDQDNDAKKLAVARAHGKEINVFYMV